VGGITEARRIVALAATYDVAVIPHGSSVFSYHLQVRAPWPWWGVTSHTRSPASPHPRPPVRVQYAYPNCPMAEFLVLSPDADKIVPLFGDL
jgi:L-rhamnonate dehydratase